MNRNHPLYTPALEKELAENIAYIVNSAIDRVVAIERERCAKIAENYLIPEGTPEGIEIARLIRAGEGPV